MLQTMPGLFLLLVFLAGCERAEHAERAATDDPANLDAPQAVLPLESKTLEVQRKETPPKQPKGHDEHSHHEHEKPKQPSAPKPTEHVHEKELRK